jgi:hypothetical protein
VALAQHAHPVIVAQLPKRDVHVIRDTKAIQAEAEIREYLADPSDPGSSSQHLLRHPSQVPIAWNPSIGLRLGPKVQTQTIHPDV